MNRANRLLDWNHSSADRVALISDHRSYTWGELAELVLRAAHLLSNQHASVGVGTRVGLLLDSTTNFVVYQHAIHYLGGVVVPLNRGLTTFEIADVTSRFGIDVLVLDRGGVPAMPPTRVLEVSGDLDIPDLDPRRSETDDGRPGLAAEVRPVDPAMILQTSGSTGRPKGIVLSHANLAANYDPTHRWIGIGREDVILLALPIFNTYALNQGVNLMVSAGATLRLLRRFDADRVGVELERHRVTFLPLVPTMVTRLREAGIRYERPLTVFVGAAPSPTQLVEDVWSTFPRARLLTGYGLTEATALVTMAEIGNPDDRALDVETCGQALPGVGIRIEGTSASGTGGEVLVRGAGVFVGYVGDSSELPVDDEGWLHTGDIGRLDDRGRLTIVGRHRDLILRGGQNIYPGEIERALTAHPEVADAVAFGLPDPDYGEVPGAVVVPRVVGSSVREGAVGPELGERLRQWLTGRLAPYKVPVSIAIHDQLPRTPTGKVHRGQSAALVIEPADEKSRGEQ